MKYFLKVTLYLFASTAFGQQAWWEWQNPKPQGSNLHDVVMLDSMTYLAVGDAGLVIKTTDNGATWDLQTLPTPSHNPLHGIACSPDKLHGVTLSHGGAMFATTDQGKTWKSVTSGSSTLMRDVCYLTDLDAIAVGMYGVILRSSDGGITWQRAALEIADHLWSVNFVDSQHGFIAAQFGIIYETSNGGAQWVRKQFPFGNSLYAVDLFDPQSAIAGGETGGVFLTNDSGKTWQQQQGIAPYNINSVIRLNKERAVVCGDLYNLYLTTDAGLTWRTPLTDNRRNHLESLAFSTDKEGVCVGSGGIILRTSDGGVSWYSVFEKVAGADLLRGVYCLDTNTAVAVGSALLRTSNAGKKWETVPNPTSKFLYAVDFVESGKVGYAVGDSGVVLKTTDKGLTWMELQTPFRTISLRGLSFLNKDTGIVVGREGGTICQTFDGGISWKVSKAPIDVHLNSAEYLGSDKIFILGTEQSAGNTGILYRSDDGGATWNRSEGSFGATAFAISFFDPLNGYIVGAAGETDVFAFATHTADGGATWKAGVINGAGYGGLYGVSASDAACATAVGSSGMSFRTIDGGATWNPVETDTRGTLYAVHHPSGGTATAVGFKATILRLTATDKPLAVYPLPSGSSSPMVVSIYPNPAVLRTRIEFSLGSADIVTIGLFTVEGKILRQLYRGLVAEGDHSLEADLHGLAAGSYLLSFSSSKGNGYHRLVIRR